MELKKPIYYFILVLTLISVVNFLFYEIKIIGGVLWTFLNMGLLAVGLFFSYKIINDFEFENSYFKFIFRLFFIYQIILIARGFTTDYKTFKELILSEYLLWQFLVPLFVFFDKKLSSFVYLINAIYFLGIFFLVICLVRPSFIITRSTAESFIIPLTFGCGFVLLNARYVSNKKWIVAFFALFVGLLSFTYLARRNAVVSYGGLILMSIFLNNKSLSAVKFFKLIPVFCAVFIIAVFGIDYIPASLTSRLSDRITEDSRTDVFNDLFKSMEDHMAFGKGMRGTYYSPSGGELPDEGIEFVAVEYRDAIENGYLQLFLNGGIIYDVLFILVLLPAVVLGVFKSNNQFVQACAIVIFLWMVDMAIYGLPRLTLEYILVWISVGICYKTSLRKKTNEEIAEAFNNMNNMETS